MLLTRMIAWYIVLGLTALVCLVAGCGGNNATTNEQYTAGHTPSPATSFPTLPQPTLLGEMTTRPRSASYTEESLVCKGNGFKASLPHELVTTVGNTGRFQPAWTTGTSGLAYAIYEFDISGIDREAVVRYGFAAPPATITNVWFGVANYAGNHWQWFQCNGTMSFGLGSYAPHASSSDLLHIAVVIIGDEQVQLSFIRLGEQQIEADLAVTPSNGVAPLSATLNASGSSTAYGSLAKFEWDLDGDGVFDVDTGTTAEYDYQYTDAGQVTPAVRVTNSLGESAIATDTISISDAWARSWGSTGYEFLWDVAVDGTEAIYGVGTIYSSTSVADLLLMKLDLDGEIQWVKKWDAPGDDYGYSIDIDDSGIYVAGSTDSYFANGSDLLIQRWDRDGNVAWTRTFDKDSYDYDEAESVDVYRGSVYVAGKLSPSSTIYSGDAIVLSFALDGTLNWARSFGGAGGEGASCIAGHSFLISDTTIHVGGWSYGSGYDDGETSLLHVTYADDGTMTQLRSWGRPNTRIYPKQVCMGVILTPSYIVANYQDESDKYGALMLQLQGNNDPIANLYRVDTPNHTYAQGMTIIDDKIYLAGYTSTPFGFVMRLDFTNDLEYTQYWGINPSNVNAEFRGLAKFPGGGGLLLPGKADYADGINFTYTLDEHETLPVTSWVDHPLEQTSVTGAITSPTAGSIDITADGTVDTGGGGADALLVTRKVP